MTHFAIELKIGGEIQRESDQLVNKYTTLFANPTTTWPAAFTPPQRLKQIKTKRTIKTYIYNKMYTELES